ncbi:FAD:protein FMN transferase [Alteromonas sp. SM 2104]|nr:FAD:protein FMN transferase [Alteromonas oceanisediminis]
MGTTYNVKYSPIEGVDDVVVHQDIEDTLIRVNALMSTYDPASELSRFNQYNGKDTFPLSAETLAVMSEAKRIAELTDGALDITIGPVVNLWGFGPTQRAEKVPAKPVVEQTLAQTGIEKLILGRNSAHKALPALYVDLSTIAKGYGVDAVVSVLEAQGLDNYLVEIGGEMRVAGTKLNGQRWRIAIEKPVSTERSLQKIIEIGNNGIATSGDYRNYYEQDGVRYSHIIDPRTGYPIQHNLVSVTVVHPSAMTADGLATALLVKGAAEAMNLAEENELAVLLISKEGDEFVEWISSAFERDVTTVTP